MLEKPKKFFLTLTKKFLFYTELEYDIAGLYQNLI